MSKRAEFLRRYYLRRGFYGGIKQDIPIKFEGVRKKAYSDMEDEFAFTCTAITQNDELLASVSDGKIVLEREALWAIVNYPAVVYLLTQTLQDLKKANTEIKDLNKRLDTLHRSCVHSQLDNEANKYQLADAKRQLNLQTSRVKEIEKEMATIIANGLNGVPITLESGNMRFTIEFQDKE